MCRYAILTFTRLFPLCSCLRQHSFRQTVVRKSWNWKGCQSFGWAVGARCHWYLDPLLLRGQAEGKVQICDLNTSHRNSRDRTRSGRGFVELCGGKVCICWMDRYLCASFECFVDQPEEVAERNIGVFGWGNSIISLSLEKLKVGLLISGKWNLALASHRAHILSGASQKPERSGPNV
jgi:hypothetical protein